MSSTPSTENYPTETDTDFSQAYAEQLEKLKPLIYFSLGLIGFSILLPFLLLAFLPESSVMPYFLYALVLPVTFAIYPAYRKGLCPACGRFMAMTVGSHCPKCGVRVRKSS